MKHKNPYAEKLNEFSEYTFHEEDVLEKVSDWKTYFKSRMGISPTRFVYEIGCSNADFLIRIAAKNPTIAFIGIDWKFKVLYKGAEKIKKLGIKNVALIRGRATESERFFKPGDISEIWLFFPDPWAKKSQIKNRLFQEKYILPMASLLSSGGFFHFKTDHPGYFQWCMALLGRNAEIQGEEYEKRKQSADYAALASYTLKQAKVRVPEKDLPLVSEKLSRYFKVGEGDPQTYLYTGEYTLFEKGFVREGLPIYSFVLERV